MSAARWWLWRYAAILVLALVAAVGVSADPWPLKLTDRWPYTNVDAIGPLRLYFIEPPEPGLPKLQLYYLYESIHERQFVSATFGEPRAIGADPPPAYLHNGVDLVGRPETQIFAIKGGEIEHTDFKPGEKKNKNSTDYEALKVGEYRYMHVRVLKTLTEADRRYKDRGFRIELLPGTLIGHVLKPTVFDTSHLHLQLERTEPGRFFVNPLRQLDRWYDSKAPTFVPTHSSVAWEEPAVRVVKDFDATRGETPKAFPELTENAGGVPVVSGRVDILARVQDSTEAQNSASPNDRLGGSKRCAPADIGFEIFELPAVAGAQSRVAIPMRRNVDVQQAIPFGVDSEEKRIEVTSSEWYFKRIYRVGEEAGTWTLHRGSVLRMDYIATVQPRVPENNSPANDFFDTDTATTRNGRYVIHVEARDLGGIRGDPASGIGNMTPIERECLVCNTPRIDTARNADDPARSIELGGRVRLAGHNYFTPLQSPRFDLGAPELPRIELRQVTSNTTRTIHTIDPAFIELPASPASNVESRIVFRLPDPARDSTFKAEYDRTKKLFARVLIRCDPDPDPIKEFQPSQDFEIALGGGSFRVVYANQNHGRFETGSPSIPTRIELFDSTTRNTRTLATAPSILDGLAISAEGDQVVFGAQAPWVAGPLTDDNGLWFVDLLSLGSNERRRIAAGTTLGGSGERERPSFPIISGALGPSRERRVVWLKVDFASFFVTNYDIMVRTVNNRGEPIDQPRLVARAVWDHLQYGTQRLFGGIMHISQNGRYLAVLEHVRGRVIRIDLDEPASEPEDVGEGWATGVTNDGEVAGVMSGTPRATDLVSRSGTRSVMPGIILGVSSDGIRVLVRGYSDFKTVLIDRSRAGEPVSTPVPGTGAAYLSADGRFVAMMRALPRRSHHALSVFDSVTRDTIPVADDIVSDALLQGGSTIAPVPPAPPVVTILSD